MIALQSITKDNYRECTRLKVSEDQSKFVAPNPSILARAYAYGNEAKAFAVYNDGVMVGAILLRYYDWESNCDLESCYIIDQFMIGEHYQGKGYGKETMNVLIDELKKERKYSKITLCYVEGDEIAKKLYSDLGFYYTGEADEDEIIMAIDI